MPQKTIKSLQLQADLVTKPQQQHRAVAGQQAVSLDKANQSSNYYNISQLPFSIKSFSLLFSFVHTGIYDATVCKTKHKEKFPLK